MSRDRLAVFGATAVLLALLLRPEARAVSVPAGPTRIDRPVPAGRQTPLTGFRPVASVRAALVTVDSGVPGG